MSRPTSASEPSQQKKTALQLISDQQGFKKPSLADMRSDSGQFKRPSINDIKGETPIEFDIDKKEEPAYVPYTIDDYKELKSMDEGSNDRGGLGPSLDEEWERKREMRVKLMQFGQKIKEGNLALPKRKSGKAPEKKQPSKRDKMKEYATKIPKPKIVPKAEEKETLKVQSRPEYDIDAELQRHSHFVNRVDTLYSQLRQYLEVA